jgi:hypothetical protein
VDVSDPDFHSACTRQVTRWYGNSPLDLVEEREQGGAIAAMVLITMLMLLAGTTFAGHDWNTGSMSNQLLFEPRRGRVWAAKGLVVLVAGLVVAGAVLAAYWTGLWWLAQHRGLDVRDGVLSEAYGQALRGALVAGFAGLGGYALTMLFRSTVATLGILFAVALAGPLLITLLALPGHLRLMPQNNYGAVLMDGITVDDYNNPACHMDGPNGGESDCRVRVTKTDGALYFGGLLLLAGAPSVLSFRRRDVP